MKKQFAFSRTRFLIPLLIVFVTGFYFSSCSENKADATVGCVILTRAQVKSAWVDPGYTVPGNDLIDSIRFFSSYLGAGSDLEVAAFGLRTNRSVITQSGTDLTSGTNCATNLPDLIIYGPNQFKLSELQILETNGTLKQFNYIRLTPMASPKDPDYVCYEVHVIDRAGEHYRGRTDPCPPLCPQEVIALPPPQIKNE